MSRAGGERGPGASAYALGSSPSGRLPWRSAGYCAIDLELTGLDPRTDEIISFGAIPIEDGRARPGEAVEGKVRPERAIDEASIRVHGLRRVDLEGAPELDVAIDPLLGALAGAIPVVHFAEVERRFLSRALRRQGLRLRRPIIDTSVLGSIWLHEHDGAEHRRMMLSELAGALGLPAHRPHDALGDALTTAQIFIVLATHLDAIRSETVRSLVTAERRLQAIRTYPARRL
jgi:DNA polymerase III subunit epsilon